jgi:GT2 family glycosyltransferase
MHFHKWVSRSYPTVSAYNLFSLIKTELLRMSAGLQKPRPAATTSHPVAIYAPHGSFLIFNWSYFSTGGTLDHPTFLFGEEIFVAEAARRLKLRVVHDPRLVVFHEEHATTGIFPRAAMARYLRESSAYMADQFF